MILHICLTVRLSTRCVLACLGLLWHGGGSVVVMVDWVTAWVPCGHPEPITGGRLLKVDRNGETEWEVRTRLEVEGSHESKMMVRTEGLDDRGWGSLLLVHGNPSKWIQGHNLFGSSDLVGLVAAVMERLVSLLGLCPTDLQRALWRRGAFELTRVDVTASYNLPGRADVRAWLRSAEYSAYLKHRGRASLIKNGTLYFGQHSRRWSLKFYSKGDELDSGKGHGLPSELPMVGDLRAWANDKLRVELVMRAMELKRRGLALAASWRDNVAVDLFNTILEGLDLSAQHTLSSAALESLPPHLLRVYHLWQAGQDIRALYSRATFHRYRNALKPYGIDITAKLSQEPSNVVPLVRVLEAVPASPPDWARGTSLLFEPRSKVG